MSSFLVAMSPVLLFWLLPIVPLLYTGVVATVVNVAKRASTSVPRLRGQGAPRTKPHWQT